MTKTDGMHAGTAGRMENWIWIDDSKTRKTGFMEKKRSFRESAKFHTAKGRRGVFEECEGEMK